MVKSLKTGKMFLKWICICCLFGGKETLSLNFVKVAIKFCETAKGSIN